LWVERDIVAAGVEVTKRQTGQWQKTARICGLLDIEFDSTRGDLVPDGVD
jgi:hypothetical protein